jgi:hypothetical protein
MESGIIGQEPIKWDISGKRKALFNGFKAYNMMPVDRKEVSIKGAGAEAFASSDKKTMLPYWRGIHQIALQI